MGGSPPARGLRNGGSFSLAERRLCTARADRNVSWVTGRMPANLLKRANSMVGVFETGGKQTMNLRSFSQIVKNIHSCSILIYQRAMDTEPQPEKSLTAQVGRQIMLVRTERGVLQGDLAAGAKLKQSQLSGMERGKRPITIEHLGNFARVLRCSVVDLLPPSAKLKQGN